MMLAAVFMAATLDLTTGFGAEELAAGSPSRGSTPANATTQPYHITPESARLQARTTPSVG